MNESLVPNRRLPEFLAHGMRDLIDRSVELHP